MTSGVAWHLWQRRIRNLPYIVQQHLGEVVFHELSRSSEFKDSTSSAGGDAQAAQSSARSPKQALPAPRRNEQERRTPWSDESDKHTSGAERSPTLLTGDDVPECTTLVAPTDMAVEDVADSQQAQNSAPHGWSAGSEQHEEGKCKPCHYVHTKLGCLRGEDCQFCHMLHTAKSRPRPCKSKRAQCQRIATMIELATSHDPEHFAEAAKVLASHSSYMRSVIETQEKKIHQEHSDGSATTAAPSSAGSAGGAIASLKNLLTSADRRGGACSSGSNTRDLAIVRENSEDIVSI